MPDFPKIKQHFEHNGKKYIFKADLFCCETVDGMISFGIIDFDVEKVD